MAHMNFPNPNLKMAHMNFLPGGGSGKRIFPEKIKVSPRGSSHGVGVRIPYPAPSLWRKKPKNFLTKKCRCHRDFLKIFKNFTFSYCAFRLGGVIFRRPKERTAQRAERGKYDKGSYVQKRRHGFTSYQK